ncbi:MAG TPA: AEC family transporter [Bacillota bacterium]|nr:AEC family transporter [Bacillota bacterium]
MELFFYILLNIILPIFILVSIGFIAQKFLKMDTRTFSRLNIYILIPAVLFIKIYEAQVSLEFVWQVMFYILAMEAIMLILAEILTRLLKYPRGIRKAFSNSLLFFNSGNFGLPLIELVFKGNLLATTGQVFIMLIQNMSTSTFGVFQASSGKSSYKQALKNVLGMPGLYVLAMVLLVKGLSLRLPSQLMVPLQYISGGFVGLALITLGVQLAEVKAKFRVKDVLLSSFIRLILSPAIGFLLVWLLGIKGVLAKSLIIGASTPTAVNTAILAREFDNEPEYASQIVLVSTIFSAVTLSVIIYLLNRFM